MYNHRRTLFVILSVLIVRLDGNISMYHNLIFRFISNVLVSAVITGAVSSVAFADIADNLQSRAQRHDSGAELFGLTVNNLSQAVIEKQLAKMGLQAFPTYKKDRVSYSLGPDGILGIKELDLVFNSYDYIRSATMSGVVESAEKRQKLGLVLEQKYGQPNVGFVKNGYGRAKWFFKDGTYIELHNTTFDVSISYVDQDPMVPKESGTIDVEALSRQTQQ